MTSNCIFCDATADSNEDAFPRWLIKRFTGPGSLEFQLSIDAPLRNKRVNCLKIRIKCVCKKCNNEWMSVLQNRAKPVIESLLDCPTSTLDINQCKTLALWAVMSTMVLETTNEPKIWRFTDPERCLFYKREQIPPFTFVWIANWIDSPGPSYGSRVLGDKSDRATVTTFGFGTLVFQVLKVVPCDATGNKTMELRPGLPWGQIMLQVWKPQVVPICWPPQMEIHGEAQLEALELRFSRTGAEASDCK